MLTRLLLFLTALASFLAGSSQPLGFTVPASPAYLPDSVQPYTITGSPPNHYKVAIQIGHYKNDELPPQLSRLVGSVGTSGGGRSEVDFNYDVSNRIAAMLRAEGVQVELLPSTVPTGYTADAFVAIHADGNASSAPRGFKISSRWSSAVAAQDAQLVETLTSAYRAATGLPEDSAVTRNMRGYYAYAPWRPNYRVSNFTPGAIVETGYMTNAADRAVLFTQTDKVAAGVATGIMNYLKAAYGSPRGTRSYGTGLVDTSIRPDAQETPVPTPRPDAPARTTTGNWQVLLFGKPAINVYADAGGGQVIATLPRDHFYRSQLRHGDYYQVTLLDGRKGWVSRNSVIVQM